MINRLTILTILLFCSWQLFAQTRQYTLVYTYDATGTGVTTSRQQVPLHIYKHPQGQQVCTGTQVNLDVAASGASLTYSWKKNGSTVVGTSQSLSLTASETATYTCTVSDNASHSEVSNKAIVVILPQTAITMEPLANYSSCESSFGIEIYAAGDNVKYQWYKDNVPIASGSRPFFYDFPTPVSSQSGQYWAVATGTCGTATTRKATVKIDALPVAGTIRVTDANGYTQTQMKVYEQAYLHISGHTGTPTWYLVQPWATETVYDANPAIAYLDEPGTYYYYAIIQSGVCRELQTNKISLTVVSSGYTPMAANTTKSLKVASNKAVASEVMAAHPSVTEIKTSNISEGLVVSPNPNMGNFSVNFGANETGEGLLSIKDASGRPVIVQKFAKEGFGYSESFSLEGLKPGFYFVEIVLADKKETAKFVVVD